MGVAVTVQRVTKRFGNLCALDDVSLKIEEGEFFGLLGPNGAGKTTLISCLAGLSRPDNGRLSVMGRDVISDYREARLRLGVVPQELVFDPFFTVRETLRLQSGYFGLRQNDDWIDEVLEKLNLTEKADVNMRRLSGGMKRRVLVAQALVHRPPIIVLDEPTAGVDVELRKELWQFIQQLNKEGHTVILTTHYLEEAEELCGRVAMLKNGKIVALDSTKNLLQRFSHYALTVRLVNDDEIPDSLRTCASKVGDNWVFQLTQFGELETILSKLREAGCAIADIQVIRADLEDVFINIMQNELGLTDQDNEKKA